MIGVYTDNLTVPWMDSIYRLAEKADVTLFTNNYGNVDVYSKIGLLASSFIWSFPYPIIATDTMCARYLYECPIPSRKIFYINRVDWLDFKAEDTIKAASLELWTTPELEKAISSVWGPTEIIRNWNYEAIQRILNR